MGRAEMDAFLEACGTGGPIRLNLEGPGFSGDELRVLGQPFAVIGRSPGRDIVLDHPDVSRRHAYLQRISGRIFCVDLGSRTGVHWSSGPAVMGWVGREGGVRIGPFRVLPAGGDEEPFAADHDPLATSRSFGAAGLADGVLEFPDAEPNLAAWRVSRALVLCGSSPLCRLRMPATGVANIHCSLVRTPQAVWVVDLIGGAHTKVNGQPVLAARLDDGDELLVGRYRVLFRRGEPAGLPGPALPLSGSRASAHPLHAANPETPAAGPSRALSFDVNQALPGRTETSDDLATALLNELSRTREQMGDQFRESLMMVLQVFGKMHQEQASLIREELTHIRRLVERGTLPPAGPTPSPHSDEEAPALRPVQAADPSKFSLPPLAAGAARDDAPDDIPARTPPAPSETPEDIHARLVARLASLQDEQSGRWQQLLGAVIGKKSRVP